MAKVPSDVPGWAWPESPGLGLAFKGSGFIECQAQPEPTQAQAQPKPEAQARALTMQHYMLFRQLISAVYVWITRVFIVTYKQDAKSQ